MEQDLLFRFYRSAVQRDPFPYQLILGTQPIGNRALVLPTGSGKTAAAVLTWLHQLQVNEPSTPLRLVYCLPRRALVEQTRAVVDQWLAALADAELLGGRHIRVMTLMGGEVEKGFEDSIDKPTIAIGTQDMLLSRALNRGYAMSRYRWPVHFGLLNSDAFWVMDEVQLFGSALATSTQLQAFRQEWGTFGPTATWWMSATFDPGWLSSVDFAGSVEGLSVTRLTPNDLNDEISGLGARYRAQKELTELDKLTADRVLEIHRPGTLTLAVVNTVSRAQQLAESLRAALAKKKSKKASGPGPTILLLHSRFRPGDRRRAHEQLVAADRLLRDLDTESDGVESATLREQGMICVATQVVEAGLDLSAETLVTEIAPWASLVQRFGRVNRFGGQDSSRIYWLDLKKSDYPPYEAADIEDSRRRLDQVPGGNVSPEALDRLGPPAEHPPSHVIRKHDLLGLFSTEPDLAGGFTDVSPFVRDTAQDTDVYVFWRDFKNPASPVQGAPEAAELCAAPIGGLEKILTNGGGWEWNGELRRWERRGVRDIRPGMTLMLTTSAGGYSAVKGWTGDPSDIPEATRILEPVRLPDAQNNDAQSATLWVSLADHLEHAAARLPSLRSLGHCELEAARVALRFHDAGKAHPKWQGAIRRGGLAIPEGGPWAKFPKTEAPFTPGVRHEAASALAAWAKWIAGEPGWTALAIYLVAAHHGKVRTVLRSRIRDDAGGEDVFGVEQGDVLSIPDFQDPATLDLSPRLFGAAGKWEEGSFLVTAPAWVEVVADLIGCGGDANVLPGDEPRGLGPFRLALLEAAIATADVRASIAEETNS